MEAVSKRTGGGIMDERVRVLYQLLARLPRCTADTPRASLPADGIYFFFEEGEHGELDGLAIDRVVRVGTHRVDGRFRDRIRQHYGNRSSLSGNKNGGVFRRHVGGALLRRENANDPRVTEWIRQGGESYPEVEEAVSRELRKHFSFVCVPVPKEAERLSLESGLIALLAQFPGAKPSRAWLGRFAADASIGTSGVWNTQHLSSEALSIDQLNRLVALAGGLDEPAAANPLEPLVVIPCGHAKIWAQFPGAGPTAAKDAYTGAPFVVNRRFAETFATRWVILSAKYGFVDPDFAIPESYDFTFKHKHPGLVQIATLRRQVTELGLGRFADVIVLGGSGYQDAARQAFAGTAANLHFPFAGLRQGPAMAAANEAVANGDPLFRKEPVAGRISPAAPRADTGRTPVVGADPSRAQAMGGREGLRKFPAGARRVDGPVRRCLFQLSDHASGSIVLLSGLID